MAKGKTIKWPFNLVYKYGTGYGFFPDTALDQEKAAVDCRVNQVYQADLKQPRNYERLKWWWATVTTVWKNDHIGFASPEKLSDAILIEAKFCKPTFRLDGEVVMEADSIAFKNMPESEFIKLCDAAKNIIWRVWGIDADALKNESRKLNEKVRYFPNKSKQDGGSHPYQQESDNGRVKATVPPSGDRGEKENSEDQAAA